MTFQAAIRSCFRQYATFSGRAGRAEFWWFTLFSILGQAVCGVLDRLLFGERVVRGATGHIFAYGDYTAGTIGSLFMLLILLPSLAVLARRLHDTDHSAWWILIGIVPVVGWIVLLVFCLQRPHPASRYA